MKETLSQHWGNANLGLTNFMVFKIKGHSEEIDINSSILQMGSDKGKRMHI